MKLSFVEDAKRGYDVTQATPLANCTRSDRENLHKDANMVIDGWQFKATITIDLRYRLTLVHVS